MVRTSAIVHILYSLTFQDRGRRRCQCGTPYGIQLAAAAPTSTGVTTAHGPLSWQEGRTRIEYA